MEIQMEQNSLSFETECYRCVESIVFIRNCVGANGSNANAS